jgi:geranylgeranyl pyrophosphate synthase
MQIEKLSRELKALRKTKSEEYGPFNTKMQKIADAWTLLVGKKIRPHQVCLMYAIAKIIRANNEYKYDSYIDAINYLVQADEIHREDVSELVDSYFPTKTKEDVSL